MLRPYLTTTGKKNEGGAEALFKSVFHYENKVEYFQVVIIEDAGIDRSPIFDQSVECQASTEVGVQVGMSVKIVGTQVAHKSMEKGIVCI